MNAIAALLLVLPLASALLWIAIGIWALRRYRFSSPFQQALTAAAHLLGAYALVDWVFLNISNYVLVGTPVLVVLAEVRGTLLTLAFLLIVLVTKWLYSGHSRADMALAALSVGSLAFVWGGMTMSASLVPGTWGPVLTRNELLYIPWLIVQAGYMAGAVTLVLAIRRVRQDLPRRLRARITASAGTLTALLAAWLSTNVYASVAANDAIPWFSSTLWIPAAIFAAAFLPLRTEEVGEIFRAFSDVQRRVSAIYVFYRTGEPLAALGASRNLPIEPEQLQGILELVGDFVETSMKEPHRYAVTSMHFDRLGILAVRGQYVIVAGVFEGPAYDALRSEMIRTLRAFEERRWKELATWEGASHIAEEIADELSVLVYRPRAEPPRGTAPGRS